MTDFKILSIDENAKSMVIDWGYVTLNHDIPLYILENPELTEEEMLRFISYMRPPVPVELTVPDKLRKLVTAAEVAVEDKAMEVRVQRNALLDSTDWTQLADSPVDQQVWASYRQQLREVPQQPGFPDSVVWPEAPA